MKLTSRIPAVLLLSFALALLLSCCRKNAPQHPSGSAAQVQQSVTGLISPKANTIITSGDSVQIRLSWPADVTVDSVAVTAGKTIRVYGPDMTDRIFWSSRNSRVGLITLRVQVYLNDSIRETHNVGLVILSDIIPKEYDYKVIAKYPHDPQAYTQGLIYDNGKLYESTGLEGKSSVRIVDIASGKPIKIMDLASQYFGEGIALFRNQVYQITYKSQVGFVYDKNTLDQIRSFDYQISEGWGLTTDGQNLVMTDGSAQLYFIEPEFFTQVDRVEVFDNKGMVNSLNETEFVSGKILANVYGESYIVIIDPLTGKVTGKLDLQALMPPGSKGDYGKVLNGIAYNPATGNFYVTGKDWPFLYEIRLIPSLR